MPFGATVNTYYESVYSTFFLDNLKPGKFRIGVRNETTVDACEACMHSAAAARERRAVVLLYIILREVSALSVQLQWTIQGLKLWDGQQSTGAHAFFISNQ